MRFNLLYNRAFLVLPTTRYLMLQLNTLISSQNDLAYWWSFAWLPNLQTSHLQKALFFILIMTFRCILTNNESCWIIESQKAMTIHPHPSGHIRARCPTAVHQDLRRVQSAVAAGGPECPVEHGWSNKAAWKCHWRCRLPPKVLGWHKFCLIVSYVAAILVLYIVYAKKDQHI